MKLKQICLLAAIMLIAALVGCKKTEEAALLAPTPAPTPEAEVVIVEPMPVHSDSWEDILNEEVPPPLDAVFAISATTGLEIDAAREYRPVFVCYDNAADGRPLSGIAEADIVYEAAGMTKGATRLLALFNDAYPAQTGPLGMAYSDFASIQKEWGCMFIHDGYPSEAGYPKLNDKDFFMRVTKDADGAAEFFFTPEDAQGSFVDLARLVPTLYAKAPAEASLRYLMSIGYPYEDATAVKKFRLPFGSERESVEYAYDADAGVYKRYQADGDGRMRDAKALSMNMETNTLESVALYANSVIVQYAEDDGGGVLQLIGSGNCDYFVSGKRLSGTWSRASEAEATMYFLSDGSVVTLDAGHTWIALLPADSSVKLL